MPHSLQDLSSPTRDGTHAPLQGKHGVLPLDHQGSPRSVGFKSGREVAPGLPAPPEV